ncbi:MAG: helix-turn-helix domain-containing protein [Defluviitaleaceae bacterium]|nr:helix-turn-helix domain-containing protein [Defluviitaleaceae bacterium]
MNLDENGGKVGSQYAEAGINAALYRKKRVTPAIQPIGTGDVEARIIALACSEPPEGRSRWTLRLLEEKVVKLNIVDTISDNTIGRLLKTPLKPHLDKRFFIPPKQKCRLCRPDGRRA